MQPFKSDHRLPEHIESLALGHLVDPREPQRAVLSKNSKLRSMGAVHVVRLDTDILGLGDGELGVTPPLVNLQV